MSLFDDNKAELLRRLDRVPQSSYRHAALIYERIRYELLHPASDAPMIQAIADGKGVDIAACRTTLAADAKVWKADLPADVRAASSHDALKPIWRLLRRYG